MAKDYGPYSSSPSKKSSSSNKKGHHANGMKAPSKFKTDYKSALADPLEKDDYKSGAMDSIFKEMNEQLYN